MSGYLFRLCRLADRPVFQFALIALAVAAVYGHTLAVPLYLDDYLSIQANPAIRTLDWEQLWRYNPLRVVEYFTFALDYHLHGLTPAGFHLGNIIIHLAAAWVVWGLARGLLRTPAMQGEVSPAAVTWLPAAYLLNQQARARPASR